MSAARPISPAAARLLDTLSLGEVRWTPPLDLQIRTGLGPSDVDDALAELAADGWIQSAADGVCLSPLAAEALGLEAAPLADDLYVWVPRVLWPDDDPAPRRRGPEDADPGDDAAPADELDALVDPRPTPEQLAWVEEAIRVTIDPYRRLQPPREPPFPKILYGVGARWDGPTDASPATCTVHPRRTLTRLEYCLVCDLWGPDAPH